MCVRSAPNFTAPSLGEADWIDIDKLDVAFQCLGCHGTVNTMQACPQPTSTRLKHRGFSVPRCMQTSQSYDSEVN